jgi:hypothetical protein
MFEAGKWLLILGGGSFVLPMFGLQFTILNLLGDSLPLVAGAMTVAGAVMMGLTYRQRA